MFQLRANAESLSLHAWLVCIVALALVGGLVLALITDPLLKALRGPFPELCAALAAEAGAAALFNSAMLTLIGRWRSFPHGACSSPSATPHLEAPSRRRSFRRSTASSAGSSPTERPWRRSATRSTSPITNIWSRSWSKRRGSPALWSCC
jgi:hypothetical protein